MPQHDDFPEPTVGLGDAAGRDPPHHPPAEPPPVPPRGMGADALSQADDPAQPAADPARAAVAPVVADRPAGAVVLLPGPAGAQPDGAGAMAGQRRPIEPGRVDRRLAEHGLRAPARQSAFQRRRETAAALLAAVRPQDHCTVVTTSAPRVPVLHDVEGSRRDELSAAVARPAAHGHARRLARRARRRRRGLAILHVSDPAAHDPDRLAEERLGARRRGDRRRWSEQGVRVRIVDVGSDETANVSLQSLLPLDRTILAGARQPWEAVIRNDSPRTLTSAKAILRVDDKPTEVVLPEIAPQQTGRGCRCRSPSRAPGRTTSRSSFPTTSCRATTSAGPPCRSRTRCLIRLVDGEPSSEPFGSEVDYLAAPLVDRHRRGRGLAGRGRAGARFPVAAAGTRRRAGPGQRRGPDARAGRAARAGSSARAWA